MPIIQPQYIIKVGNRYLVDAGTNKPTVTTDINEATRFTRPQAHTTAGTLQQRGLRTCVIEVK